MKKLILTAMVIAVAVPMSLFAQTKAQITINADQGTSQISRHIYGHFSEHLGRCIYDGLWVGEDSKIPNTKGVRNDIIDALKKIKIPNLRWPGGCFADEYHWMDGIGNRADRPKMINTHWGGVTEDNSFGTHEFLDLCETLGTEPYICGNLGSGSVEEMSKWVEYVNFDGESPMSKLRKENGREKPWNVKFWGVGNENWGCGGNMTPEFYAMNYRRYATYARNYGSNKLYKIVGGPNVDDYRWMEVMMRDIPSWMSQGVSLHYYVVPKTWGDKGSATVFDQNEYFTTINKAFYMDELVTRHSIVMDKYDPKKNIALVVDEWGAWYNVEPGTNPGFLYQQNTMRDAIVAGVTLNIFHKHSDRVKIANIAQLVNVLQSLFLTEGDKMILTPTYHLFDMYKVHQDATSLPLTVKCEKYVDSGREMDQLSVSASVKDGLVSISIVNIDPNKDADIVCDVRGFNAKALKDSKIITAKQINSYNSFDKPNEVIMSDFKGATVSNGKLTVKLPAKSVVTVTLN